MGCVSSKNLKFSPSLPALPPPDSPTRSGSKYEGTRLEKIKEDHTENERVDLQKSSSLNKGDKRRGFSLRLGSFRLTQAGGGENAAAWPAWLSAVAPEAVEGWLPLRSNKFRKLEKIGQGTYSSVYRARHVETGRLVALKKVRFNNMKTESVSFMAREIAILRKLDHPNIMKLQGIIASLSSTNIYLVFEYMEHDLAGLISNPDIKFSSAQIKCYMWQLLCGIEHCHSQGLIHRDIKTSNILVNNEGVLKIADFGLANFVTPKNQQHLTNRVVTLWYRPPEIFLGSTTYKETVDLWSVGCVFAEMFVGRPLIKGRNEVEQLHKIFKLCGTPSDEYWQKSKLPLATMFRSQHPYESTLGEICSEFPRTAVSLLETLLSVEPQKRGTASSALDSEYFSTRPYACDPSSLPKYSPSKEMDAKVRDYTRRKAGSRKQPPGVPRDPRESRKPLRESSASINLIPTEEVEGNYYVGRKINAGSSNLKVLRPSASVRSSRPSYDDTLSEISQLDKLTEISQADNRAKRDAPSRLRNQRHLRSKTMIGIDPKGELHEDQSSEHEFLNLSEELSANYSDPYPRRPCSMPLMTTGDADVSQDNHTHQASQKSRFSKDE